MQDSQIQTILETRQLTKRFPGVVAMKEVDFDVKRGEIHAVITFEAESVFKSLKDERNCDIDILRIGGGPSRSDAWNQHKANVFGVTVQRLRSREVSSIGAAVLGASAAGYFPDVEESMDTYVYVEKEYHPDMELHERYKEREIELGLI